MDDFFGSKLFVGLVTGVLTGTGGVIAGPWVQDILGRRSHQWRRQFDWLFQKETEAFSSLSAALIEMRGEMMKAGRGQTSSSMMSDVLDKLIAAHGAARALLPSSTRSRVDEIVTKIQREAGELQSGLLDSRYSEGRGWPSAQPETMRQIMAVSDALASEIELILPRSLRRRS